MWQSKIDVAIKVRCGNQR